MTPKKGRSTPADQGRRRTIPLWGSQYDWWFNAVEKQIDELGINQKFLSEWIESDPTAVNKCLKRTTPVYELLLDISDALDLPYPVVLPESFEEAFRVAKERRLARRDMHLVQITAGVAESDGKRQIRAISLADVKRWKSEQGKAQEHRAESPSSSHRAR